MDNAQKTFVILGATGGIGSELSRRLAGAGVNPILAARNEDRLKKLSGELEAPYHVVDATEGEAVDNLFARTRLEHGAIAGAANCAGAFLLKPAHMTSEKEFAYQISQNLTTAFNVVRATARHMPGGGAVVLLSSAAARVGLANHEAVAAAKAGVSGLAMSAAASYVGRGLRFNVVSPGLVQTPMTERVTRSETARRASLDLHPLGRLGEPADIAAAIEYLLGPESGWITGQTLGVDGGLSALRPASRRPAKA